MLAARAVVFGLGSLQVVLTTLAGGVLLHGHGIGLAGSVLTVRRCHVVHSHRRQAALGSGGLNTQQGASPSVLLFQDLATLPFPSSRTP